MRMTQRNTDNTVHRTECKMSWNTKCLGTQWGPFPAKSKATANERG